MSFVVKPAPQFRSIKIMGNANTIQWWEFSFDDEREYLVNVPQPNKDDGGRIDWINRQNAYRLQELLDKYGEEADDSHIPDESYGDDFEAWLNDLEISDEDKTEMRNFWGSVNWKNLFENPYWQQVCSITRQRALDIVQFYVRSTLPVEEQNTDFQSLDNDALRSLIVESKSFDLLFGKKGIKRDDIVVKDYV